MTTFADDIRIGGVWNRRFQNSDDGRGANLPHASQPNYLSRLGVLQSHGTWCKTPTTFHHFLLEKCPSSDLTGKSRTRSTGTSSSSVLRQRMMRGVSFRQAVGK